MGLMGIPILLESLFLGYQGMTAYGWFGLTSKITAGNFNNTIITILGLCMQKWGLVLCLLGVVCVILGLFDKKKSKSGTSFYIGVLVLYSVCSVLSLG